MTTNFFVPVSYGGIAINGTGAIDTQKFELPMPVVLSGIIPAAGGALYDYNYLFGAPLRPSPFSMVHKVQAATAAAARTAFDSIFGNPPTGFYGLIKQLIVTPHGSVVQYYCDAELTLVSYSQDATWFSGSSTFFPNITATYKPLGTFLTV